jgi:hypothetical protein
MSERSDLIKKRRRKTTPLVLDGAAGEWQGLSVCAMGASDLIAFDERKPKDLNDTRAMFFWTISIIPPGIVDAEGVHVFTSDDIGWLANEEPDLIHSVAQQVRNFNFVTKERIEEEKKSSEPSPSAA